MQRTQMPRQAGFTLVEIAIVLVIIGLLLGGVLKGQELINSARVKSIVNDMKSVQVMHFGYQDKYRVLAGDDGAAATRFPVSGSSPAATAGNGNGVVNGAFFSGAIAAGTDSTFFWQHVRRAGLASGSDSLPPTTPVADYLPKSGSTGNLGVSGITPFSAGTSIPGATLYVCSNNINGALAKQIDTNVDDGATNTGSYRVRANIVTGAGNGGAPAAIATATIVDATMYVVCTGF